jgi:hypothetical protein
MGVYTEIPGKTGFARDFDGAGWGENCVSFPYEDFFPLLSPLALSHCLAKRHSLDRSLYLPDLRFRALSSSQASALVWPATR